MSENTVTTVASVDLGKKVLIENLKIASKIVKQGGKSRLAILEYALFKVKDPAVIMQVTNLSHTMSVMVSDAQETDALVYDGKRGFEITKPDAEVCINIHKLKSILEKLSKKQERVKIDIVYDNDPQCGYVILNDRFHIMDCLSPEDFPDIPVMPYRKFEPILDYDKLNTVNILVSNDMCFNRPHIGCIYFDAKNQNYAATDGSRLNVQKSDVPFPADIFFPKSLFEILNTPYMRKVRTGYAYQEKNEAGSIYVLLDHGYISTRKVDNSGFPKYGEIIESDIHTILSMADKSLLTDLIAEAETMADDRYKGVMFSFNGHFNISLVNPDLGEYNHNVQVCDYTLCGEDGDIMLNPRYLRDAINLIPGDGTNIYFSGYFKGPIRIETPDGTLKACVMPMHI